MRRLAITVALASALAACGSPCQDLGTRICKCTPEGTQRDNCNRAIDKQVKSGNPHPGSDDQNFCEQKLKTCADPGDDPSMCDRLVTEEGKIACGLAY